MKGVDTMKHFVNSDNYCVCTLHWASTHSFANGGSPAC